MWPRVMAFVIAATGLASPALAGPVYGVMGFNGSIPLASLARCEEVHEALRARIFGNPDSRTLLFSVQCSPFDPADGNGAHALVARLATEPLDPTTEEGFGEFLEDLGHSGVMGVKFPFERMGGITVNIQYSAAGAGGTEIQAQASRFAATAADGELIFLTEYLGTISGTSWSGLLDLLEKLFGVQVANETKAYEKALEQFFLFASFDVIFSDGVQLPAFGIGTGKLCRDPAGPRCYPDP